MESVLPFSRRVLFAVVTLLALATSLGVRANADSAPAVDPGPTPRAHCGPGSMPETGAQGRMSAADVASGRAAKGFTCNTELLSHFGVSGGYKVFRYVDAAGHQCGYYDSTLLFPKDLIGAGDQLTGVYVLDMSDPTHPVKTDNLLTPAMQSPHESLSLNQARGLLSADMGNPLFAPGFVDTYDLTQDCRHPVLKSSLPTGLLGHEGNFAPDGKTFYSSSAGGGTITAVDLTNPATPSMLWTTTGMMAHGLTVSDDGNRLYYGDLSTSHPGLTILDVSQVQKRMPNPKVTVVSHITWPEVSIPQVPIKVTINNHPYLVEIDEFVSGLYSGLGYDPKAHVGAARIIDIGDDTHPKVISNIRLEVNMPKDRTTDEQNDPGATSKLQGYTGHYCAVPQRVDPGIVACSFILSGMRVFDIRDPYHPKEIAYFNAPPKATSPGSAPTDYAMSAPAFDPAKGDIWYTDGNSGFYAVHVTNGVWPFRTASVQGVQVVAGSASMPGAKAAPSGGKVAASSLPATGGSVPVGVAAVVLALALALRRIRRHAPTV
jgi:hypothetical protein